MTKKKFYPDANQNLDFAKMEEDILKFWQEQKIFEKSVEMRNFANELDEDNTSPVVNPCSLKECFKLVIFINHLSIGLLIV